MNSLRLLAGLGLAAAAFAVRAEVAAPASTGQVAPWKAAGPFLFRKPAPEGDGTIGGFRPLWVQTSGAQGDVRSVWVLYPLFTYAADADTYRWNILQLIRKSDRKSGAPAPASDFGQHGDFEVWPFWFSRQTGDPAMSYRALFPVAGTIINRIGFERASWVLFPLYAQTEKLGAVTTATPWPFVRVTRGAAQGFALWPLFGWNERPGVSRDEFYLWPLGFNSTTQPDPDAPPGTPARHAVGVLPFYARSTGPGFINEDFAWPFFGYTDRTAPYRYHETRYFWPFLVQGRGDNLLVNRWGPFYTHSIIKGLEKTWIVWPLFRQLRWTDAGLTDTKTQFFYFIYRSDEQRSATHPNARPATVRHFWPLLSTWDNGAGRRQWQVLSPFEPFFPGNEKVRETWTPLFTLFRYDQRAPGDVRYSLLWDIITWETHAASPAQTKQTGQRIALGRGLIGLRRAPGERVWRAFLFDFPPKAATSPVSAHSP